MPAHSDHTTDGLPSTRVPNGEPPANGIRQRLHAHRRAPLIWQFVKFATVGVSNTLLSFAVYTILEDALGVEYLLASAIGFTVGAVNGFLLNRRYTFPGHVGDALTPVRWTVVQVCGLAADEGLLYAYVQWLGLDELVGYGIAIVMVVVATFFANRVWTFRGTAEHSGQR